MSIGFNTAKIQLNAMQVSIVNCNIVENNFGSFYFILLFFFTFFSFCYENTNVEEKNKKLFEKYI